MNNFTECSFQETWDKVINELKQNLTREEYEELLILEYILTLGCSENLNSDYERYKYLSNKR